MDYGIWESLACLSGNRLSGHEKIWLIRGYGLSQVWVKTETTVVLLPWQGNTNYPRAYSHTSSYELC